MLFRINMRKEKQELVFVACVIGIMLLLNALPWVARAYTNPPGRVFIPFHNSVGDYPSYVAYIRQGIDGQLLAHNLFTPKPHAGGVIFIFYVILGHLGRMMGITDAHAVYHVSRYILGAYWLLTIYAFARFLLVGRFERLLAFALAATSSSFPQIVWNGTQPTITWFMAWWTELDPIRRAAFLPHYSAGHILLVVTLMLFLHFLKTNNKSVLLLSIVLGWVAGLIHTPSLIILLLVLPLYILTRPGWRAFISLIAFGVISVTSLLLVNWQSQHFPWFFGRWYEGLSFAVFLDQYVLALGPIVLLAVVGAAAGKIRYRGILILWIVVALVATELSKRLLALPYPIIRTFPLQGIRQT